VDAGKCLRGDALKASDGKTKAIYLRTDNLPYTTLPLLTATQYGKVGTSCVLLNCRAKETYLMNIVIDIQVDRIARSADVYV
jgi:hypothetical protein